MLIVGQTVSDYNGSFVVGGLGMFFIKVPYKDGNNTRGKGRDRVRETSPRKNKDRERAE